MNLTTVMELAWVGGVGLAVLSAGVAVGCAVACRRIVCELHKSAQVYRRRAREVMAAIEREANSRGD